MRLENMSKSFFCQPAKVALLFLAAQIAFVSAFNVQIFKDKPSNVSITSNPNSHNLNEISALNVMDDRNVEVSARRRATSISNNPVLLSNNAQIKNITHDVQYPCDFKSIGVVAAADKVDINKGKFKSFMFNYDKQITVDKAEKSIESRTLTEFNERTKINQRRLKRSTNVSGTFTRPDRNAKLAMIINDIKKMKDDISHLKNSASVSSIDKARLVYLETIVEQQQKNLDDHIKELEQKINYSENAFENVIQTVNFFTTELNSMKLRAALQERIQYQKQLPAECIEAIRSHNLKTAEEKLKMIDDDSKINLIVKEVYNHQVGNFDLLLRFGEVVQNIPRSFLVYKALKYEMFSNGHKDIFKFIKFVNSLKKEIINQKNVQSEKNEAESIVLDLKNDVELLTEEKLKDAILLDRYASVNNIANEVYSFDNTLFKNAIEKVVNYVYERVDTKNLVTMMRSHKFIGQSIYGYAAVFHCIQSNGNSNSKLVLTLADYMKESMEMDNYRYVDEETKLHLENLKRRLPQSVKSIVFSTKVCIQNIAYGEYLYAASAPLFQYDRDRRYIFTWIPGGKGDQFYWKIEKDRNGYLIKNIQYNEYMYSVGDNFKYDNQRRRIFTWIPGGSVIQAPWEFELQGDNVRIKNVHFPEYLFADSSRTHDTDRRHVFTFTPGVPTPDSTWLIKDCS